MEKAYIFSFFAAFFAFSWRITQKHLVKHTKSDLTFSALTDFFAFVFLLILVIVNKDTSYTLDHRIILFVVVSSALSAFGDFLLLYSNKYADASDSSILLPLSNLWVFLFGTIFFSEVVTMGKVIGIPLIVLGSVVTLWKGSKLQFNRGIVAALLYGFIITGTIFIDKNISPFFGALLYSCIFYFLSAAFLIIASLIFSKDSLIPEIKINFKSTLLIGIQWALFTVMLISAYSHGEASEVIPMFRVFIVFVTLYSIYVLKETDRKVQKLLGSLIVTAGVLILSFVK